VFVIEGAASNYCRIRFHLLLVEDHHYPPILGAILHFLSDEKQESDIFPLIETAGDMMQSSISDF